MVLAHGFLEVAVKMWTISRMALPPPMTVGGGPQSLPGFSMAARLPQRETTEKEGQKPQYL